MRLTWVLLLSSSWGLAASVCKPVPKIDAELKHATASGVQDRADFDPNVAPFRVLRERYPQDLFVHERYQDAIEQYGIEGHLRKLIEEYQALLSEHENDVMYQFLFRRALIGRNTPSAIEGMSEILQAHPDFAPAHGALAEIYASPAFRDAEKENVERERLQELCPGYSLRVRPDPLPDPSPLVEQAEHLLTDDGDPKQALQLANDSLRADEWRLQRVRPFDWYSVDYKKQQQTELQAKYWRVWSLEVRAYRKAQQSSKADELLKRMEERATALRNDTDHPNADLAQWDALATLARLYAEGDQKDLAEQKLDAMRQLLVKHPDISRASQVEDLQKTISISR